MVNSGLRAMQADRDVTPVRRTGASWSRDSRTTSEANGKRPGLLTGPLFTIRQLVRCWRSARIRGAQDVDSAVQAAREAFGEWRSTPVLERAQFMHHFKNLVEERFDDIAEVLVRENGKTLDEARGEIRRGIESIDFSIGVPFMMRNDGVEDISSGIDETTLRQPVGVFAAITPFNFPFMVPVWFLPTAITCGNTFILKPSPQTPLSMQITCELIDELDIPEGVVNMVHGGVSTAHALMEHPGVAGVSFVGSSPVAKIIYETCTRNGKRVQAQGGAKNFIAVMPDADMESSVRNVLGAAYGCAGQRCLAAAVAVGVGDAYERLRDELVKQVAGLRVGYGLVETSQMGTVVSAQARERIVHLIGRASRKARGFPLTGASCRWKATRTGCLWARPSLRMSHRTWWSRGRRSLAPCFP